MYSSLYSLRSVSCRERGKRRELRRGSRCRIMSVHHFCCFVKRQWCNPLAHGPDTQSAWLEVDMSTCECGGVFFCVFGRRRGGGGGTWEGGEGGLIGLYRGYLSRPRLSLLLSHKLSVWPIWRTVLTAMHDDLSLIPARK